MQNLSLNHRPVKLKDIVHQTMPPDTILLNLHNGYYYSTNNIGAAVWDRCNGSNTISRIIEEISQDCGKSAEEVRNDIMGFLRDMINERLVTVE